MYILNLHEIGCILKYIHYIYHVVDYFSSVLFQSFVGNVAVIRVNLRFTCLPVTVVNDV
jgi:hypothetical protein